MNKDNLTEKQLDENGLSKWAVYCPALSGFYGTIVGRQRYGEHIEYSRIPADFENGVEGMNWLNPDQGYFTYKWSLYSAGHAKLDPNVVAEGEDMVRTRDPDSFLLMDSGGYQIATGKWEGDWRANSGCPKAQKYREDVLNWIDAFGDYGMILDIPAWVAYDPIAKKKCCIEEYQDAVDATLYNNEYFIKHRKGVDNGGAKFLNVLQGSHHSEAETWYQTMKKFNDPKQYPGRHFNGWSFGGQNAASSQLMLKRIVSLIHDGLLNEGENDWIHLLGVSKIEWGLFATDIQNAVRKYHNPRLTISFDSASPFLATANAQIYVQNHLKDRKKWRFQMTPSVDDKKYATDNRRFADAVLQDKIFTHFETSPIIDRCKVSDVCYYKPGDLNKIGKEGRTSWDTFSYAIQMGHNVHRHITAIQEANRLYADKTACPKMLVDERHDRQYLTDIVDEIFRSDRQTALDLIEKHTTFLTTIIGGTKGFTGKKEVHGRANYVKLFDEENVDPLQEDFVEPESLSTKKEKAVVANFDALFTEE